VAHFLEGIHAASTSYTCLIKALSPKYPVANPFANPCCVNNTSPIALISTSSVVRGLNYALPLFAASCHVQNRRILRSRRRGERGILWRRYPLSPFHEKLKKENQNRRETRSESHTYSHFPGRPRLPIWCGCDCVALAGADHATVSSRVRSVTTNTAYCTPLTATVITALKRHSFGITLSILIKQKEKEKTQKNFIQA
jgi:hypothetical protein